MFEFHYTCDTPVNKWCHVWKIVRELELFKTEVWDNFAEILRFNLLVVFRCLPVEFERKSFRRFYKGENMLCLDIVIDEEELRPFYDGRFHPLDINKQKKIIGRVFFNFLVKTFDNYKKKLPTITHIEKEFLKVTEEWLMVYDWL